MSTDASQVAAQANGPNGHKTRPDHSAPRAPSRAAESVPRGLRLRGKLVIALVAVAALAVLVQGVLVAVAGASELVAALSALAAALILALFLAQHFWRPLGRLSDVAEAVAAGRLHERVPVPTERHDEIGDLARAFAQLSDQVAEANTTIRQASMRDGLTGLLDKREFMRQLAVEVARSERAAAPLSLLLLDVDDFQSVSETHGALSGEAVLVELAAAFERHVRPPDVLARFALDEFAVLLPGASADQALSVAQRLRAEAAAIAAASGLPEGTVVTVSIGVVTRRPGQCSPDRTVELADAARFRAHEAGGDRVEIEAGGR